MSENAASEIKSHIHLLEYARRLYGDRVHKAGRGIFRVVPCPACGGHKGFTVYDTTDSYYCFGCGASGDVIGLYMLATGKPFLEALADLAKEAGIAWDPKAHSRMQELQDLKNRAAEYYHRVLMEGSSDLAKKAREYLLKTRKISEKTIQYAKIGLSDGQACKYFNGESDEDLERVGLMGKKGGDYWTAGWLLFPHFYRDGVSHFSSKPIVRGQETYQSRKEHRHPACVLYGQDIMDRSIQVVYVEGEFDRLQIIDKTGFLSVVATNGNLTQEQIDYVGRPENREKEHYLLFDNDDAGEKYSYRLMEKGSFQGWKFRLCELSKRYKDIDAQLVDSLDPITVFADLVREAKKFSQANHRLFSDGGYYSVMRPGGQKGQPYKQRISNFLMELRRRYVRTDGIHREVVIRNERGDESRPFIMEPGQMVGLGQFKNSIVALGNFIFEGKEADLNTLWQDLFDLENGVPVYEEDHVGFLHTHDIWLFGNVAISKGRLIKMDYDGIAWDSQKGFKPTLGRSVSSATKDLADQSVYLPTMETVVPESWDGFYEFLDLLLQNTGTYGSWIGAGWFLACVFGPEIFRKTGQFPILCVYGKAQSGKNTLAQLLAPLWGLSEIDFILLPEATQTGLSRRLAYYSEMPVIIDEYRNDLLGKQFDGYFRGVYNRTGAVKAERDGTTSTRQVEVRGMACLMGEHYPSDMALQQRCLRVQLQQGKRNNDALLPELRKRAGTLSGYTVKLLLEKEQRLKEIMDGIDLVSRLLEKRGYDHRTSFNYAVPLAVLTNILGPGDRTASFLSWAKEESNQEYRDKTDETWVSRFIENLVTMRTRKMVSDEAFLFEEASKDEKKVTPGLIGYGWMYFSAVYDAWAESRVKLRENPWPKKMLLDHLREEPYVDSYKQKRFVGGEPARWALKFRLWRNPDDPRDKANTPSMAAALFKIDMPGDDIEEARHLINN